MEKSKLVLDCDDIVFPFVDQFILYLNNERGMNLKREDFDTYNLQKVCGDKYFLQTLKKLNGFYHSPYFKQAKPIEGAINFVNSLKENYDSIHIVTSRPRILKKETNNFLEFFFPGIIESTHFSKNNTCFNGSRKTKAEICRELGSKIIIEDCLEYAIQCAEEGIKAILINNPWNPTSKDPPGVYRVPNLLEAGKYALALARA